MRSGRILRAALLAGLTSLTWLSVSSPASAEDPIPMASVRPHSFPSAPRRFNPKLGRAAEIPNGVSSAAPEPEPPPPRPAATPTQLPPTVAPPSRSTFVAPVAPIVVAPRPKPRPRPKKPPAPTLPAPSLALTLEAPAPDAPWTLRAKNTGDVPLRITADPRIVAFEITAPNGPPAAHAARAGRPVRCELPADMRPSDDDDRELIVPPGRTYAEKIDPRLFCFGAHDAAALVAGASVVPRLVGSRDVSVVAPLEDDAKPTLATLTELTGTAATIGAAPPSPPKDPSRPRSLAISSPAFVDAERAPDATVTLTATDESTAPIVLLLRPETIALDITGPTGIGVTDPSPTVHCAWGGAPPAPIRELFTHLSPKASDSLTVLPDAICPDGALDQPGLYIVRGRLDTRRVSGASVGLHTLNAEIAGEGMTRVRIRRPMTGTRPPPKPELEPLPAR